MYGHHRDVNLPTPPFPTRRSSDLDVADAEGAPVRQFLRPALLVAFAVMDRGVDADRGRVAAGVAHPLAEAADQFAALVGRTHARVEEPAVGEGRKSTRLNSSP